MSTNETQSRKVITPESILSYPHLFEPSAVREGDEEKYSAVFIFPEGTDLSEMKRAAVAAAKEKFGAKASKLIEGGKLRMPFRTDVEEKGYPEGSVFVSARTRNRPGVVSTIPDPNNGGRPMRVEDPEEIYPGAIARASLVAFGYDVSGNKGVSFALNNVQKVRDGDRLDGRVKAVDEFSADENAVADLSDLTGEDEGVESETGSLDFKDLL